MGPHIYREHQTVKCPVCQYPVILCQTNKLGRHNKGMGKVPAGGVDPKKLCRASGLTIAEASTLAEHSTDPMTAAKLSQQPIDDEGWQTCLTSINVDLNIDLTSDQLHDIAGALAKFRLIPS